MPTLRAPLELPGFYSIFARNNRFKIFSQVRRDRTPLRRVLQLPAHRLGITLQPTVRVYCSVWISAVVFHRSPTFVPPLNVIDPSAVDRSTHWHSVVTEPRCCRRTGVPTALLNVTPTDCRAHPRRAKHTLHSQCQHPAVLPPLFPVLSSCTRVVLVAITVRQKNREECARWRVNAALSARVLPAVRVRRTMEGREEERLRDDA